MEKHYLYRHIRLDKNEPFYIGIGTVTKAELTNKTISSFFTEELIHFIIEIIFGIKFMQRQKLKLKFY